MEEQETKNDRIMARIKRIDHAAEILLSQIENPEVSDAQKNRAFAQLMAWEKLRMDLLPKTDGDKLKEMSDVIAKSGPRSGSPTPDGRGRRSALTTVRDPDSSKDGRAINDIIRNLPRHNRTDHGDQESAQCPRGGALGNGRSVPPNGGGDVSGDVDGAINFPLL